MANYKGHIGGGVGAGFLYSITISYIPIQHFAEVAGLLQEWQVSAAIFVVAILFGLFPDVDINSKAQDMFYGILLPIDILLIINGNIQAAAYLGLIAMLPVVSHHRGWTHRKWAILIVPLPILVVPYLYNDAILPVATAFYGAAVTGYFSHLLLDGLIWKRFRIKN